MHFFEGVYPVSEASLGWVATTYLDPNITPFSEIEAAALNVLCSVEWVTLRTKLRTDRRPPEGCPRLPSVASFILHSPGSLSAFPSGRLHFAHE